MNDVLEHYLGNPLFRAARYEELVIDDDPYRRPVRPDDLGMVDFATSLTRENATQLSGLMAHRILLNIFDTRKLLLPRDATGEKWQSFRLFYDPANVSLGELVRPYLEQHVFEFVRDAAAERVRGESSQVSARVRELAEIRDEPHSYYQYYLPSSLALMNYLNATYQPGQVFAFAGALVAQHLEAE